MRDYNYFRKQHSFTVLFSLTIILSFIFTILSPIHASNSNEFVSHKVATKVKNNNLKKVSIEIIDLSPQTIVDEEDVTLTIKITNHTNKTYNNANLNLYVQTTTPLSRLNLQKQLKARNHNITELIDNKKLSEIPPGEIVKTITIDKEKLPLNNIDQWGPRKITAELFSENSKNNSFPTSHSSTFLIWDPDVKVQKTKISIIAPVTFTDEEILKATKDGLTNPTEIAKHRLNDLFKLSALPNVSLAIDPAIFDNSNVDFQNIATENKSLDTKNTQNKTHQTLSQTQNSLIQTFNDSNTNTEIIALPYANMNLLKLREITKNSFSLKYPQDSKNTLSEIFPNSFIQDNVLIAEDNSLYENANLPKNINNIIVSEDAVQTKEELNYSPNGIAVLSEKQTLSVFDKEMSDLFADNNISKLNLRQMLIAHTAIITRQRPNDPRQFLIKLPNDFSATPNQVSAISELFSAAWVENIKYSSFIEKQPESIYTPIFSSKDNLKLFEKSINKLEIGQRIITKLSSIISQENNLEKEYSNIASYALSDWDTNVNRLTYIENLNDKSASITQKIKIIPSKHINLINSQTHIPVTVTNTLPYSIKADMNITSSNTLLQSGGEKNINVPAFGTTVVQIPVKTIANGETDVNFTLTNKNNEIIVNSPSVKINVRADWEDTGTIIIAIFLGFLFLAGLFRNIYKNRKRMNEDTSNSFKK